jgi:mono/diheme cytochrome c family protein
MSASTFPQSSAGRALLAALLACAGMVASGCRQDMHDQPKYKVNGWSNFFPDHRNNRPLVPNTIARGRLHDDDLLYRGRIDGKFAEVYPMAITADVLERGRQRYAIYCLPCHSPEGDGNGIAVQRGMKRPPSYHIERLQKVTPGYLYDVITNGFGSMYDYADRINVQDRWAIVAYVQTLQASQNTQFDQLTPVEQDRLVHEQPAHPSKEHEPK